nr:GEM-like protein 4 [Ipomoea batatas]
MMTKFLIPIQIRIRVSFSFDLNPDLSIDSVKGKLILGAKLLRAGGIQKVFKKNFGVREGEKLLKASQCCLSTTAGPLAGLLFVSTEKVGFLSERSIRIPSSSGKSKRMHYKVLIPIAKIKTANESKNLKNPSEKYVQVVTEDHFEFWFMWFQQHQRTLKYLQDAISQSAQQCEGQADTRAKLLRAGGIQKVFKKNFGVREGEKLLKASQCCLSTTAGPLSGLLFVSTEKVWVFLVRRSIRVPSFSGKSMESAL